jgi:hypothetical protein
LLTKTSFEDTVNVCYVKLVVLTYKKGNILHISCYVSVHRILNEQLTVRNKIYRHFRLLMVSTNEYDNHATKSIAKNGHRGVYEIQFVKCGNGNEKKWIS